MQFSNAPFVILTVYDFFIQGLKDAFLEVLLFLVKDLRICNLLVLLDLYIYIYFDINLVISDIYYF